MRLHAIPNAKRVLTDPGRLPGKLSDLSAALEALGTPLEGVPVEVASHLRTRVAQQERTSQQLRKLCASHAAARAAAEAQLARQSDEMAELRQKLARLSALSEHPSPDGAPGGAGGAPDVRPAPRS